MTRRRVHKVWLGVGAAVLGGVLPAGVVMGEGAAAPGGHGGMHMPAPAAAPGAPAAPGATPGGEGGEGGESGANAKVQLHPDVRFYRAIELTRGHLLVGDELVAQGRWDDALPHFLHPTEELYPIIKPDLKAYKTRPFESALKALAQTVKARRADSYAEAKTLVEEQLKRADEGVRGFQKDWPAFTVEVALECIRTAAEEYSAGLGKADDGSAVIKSPVEYQDARGFVWQAARRIETVAPELAKRDAEALAGLREAISKLKETWPTAVPPPKPVKDLSAVLGDIARIELKAGAFQQ
jgi:hypothetical protein